MVTNLQILKTRSILASLALLLMLLPACSIGPAPTHGPRFGKNGKPNTPTPPQMPSRTPYPTNPPAASAGGQPASAAYAAPPQDPIQEAMTFEALHTDETHLEPGSLYTMSVRNESVKGVLLALGRQSPFNFVISPDVEGHVTLDMKNVPLTYLMDAIVQPLDLTYRMDGDVIWVEPVYPTSEFFTLNYILTRRTSTRTVTGSTIAGSGDFESNTSNNGVDTVSSTERTAVFENVRRSIALLLSEQGEVEINEESGMVSVVDYRENLVRIEKFLKRVTEALNRQVMITAKLVEVTYSKGNEFGIDWSAIAGDFALTVGSRTTDELLSAVVDSKNVDSTIRAIAERNNISIKNSPNVSTLNNQAAIIVLGEQQVFFETVEDLDDQTGQVIRRRTSPRSITIGVSLHVVPQISSNGMIVMNVHNRVTEKINEVIGPDGTVVPELSVREVDTIARLRPHQTMIIAGLTTETDSKATSGVPILSDIPWIGDLVTSRRNEKRKTELVLFLTPTLVNP